MNCLVDPPAVPTVPVRATETSLDQEIFPVHRIYCVGRNYADHIKEMGGDSKKDAPVFFCKPADAVLHCPVDHGGHLEFPLFTNNLHHEVELVLAIGKAGTKIPIDQATDYIVAYGVGIDLTRRDQQAEAKKSGGPWDVAKALDQGAPIASLAKTPPPADANIWCKVNGETKQQGTLSQMIWSLSEIIHHLSERFQLCPGDLIFTGTPAGVGPLNIGDTVEAGIDGLPGLQLSVKERTE